MERALTGTGGTHEGRKGAEADHGILATKRG